MAKVEANYSKVDWSLTNAEIARQLKRDISTVRAKRAKLGLPPSKGSKNTGIEMLESGAIIDWDKSIRYEKTGNRRTKICVSCCACGKERFLTCVSAGQLRAGKCNKCNSCTQKTRTKKSKLKKKGKSLNSYGYVRITWNSLTKEQREKLQGFWPEAKHTRNLLEHRVIMALYLQRKLCKDEIVHHIDGDKQNNKLSNLELVDRKLHSKDHKEILKELAFWKSRAQELENLIAASL